MKRNEFYLVTYKGKFDIICDELDELDYEVGRISREKAIEDVEWRTESACYYGIPAYIGYDKELKKLYG